MAEPVFVSTVAGADEAVRRGNRRRARSAAVSGGVALGLAALLVASPWQHGSGRDSLVPARQVPHPAPTAVPPSARVVAAAPVTSTGTGTDAGRPGVGPVERSPLAVSRPSATAPAPRAVSTSSPITRGSAVMAGSDLCEDDAVDAAQGWCLRYTGPQTARRGHPVALVQELCRLAAYPARSITFTSTREALMAVSGGSAQWQAGQGERYTSPGRTVTVRPGTCLTWTSTWDTRGADGFLVTPGTYEVSVGVESGATTTSVGSQIEVTD